MNANSTAVRQIHAFPGVRPTRRLWPRWVSEEWLFWLVFLSWTVLPSTRTPIWSVASIPVKSTDLLLAPLCVLFLLPRIISPVRRYGRTWHRSLPVWLLIVTTYGAVSVAWSGLTHREALAMILTMVLTASSALFGYCVVSSLFDLRGFLVRFCFALSGVSLLYTAQSVLGLGLRSAAAVTLNDFGMERVRGPLFEASTGYFLLIPPLAFMIQETLAHRIRPLYGFSLVFSLAVAILGMGSRAGYALLGLFILAFLFFVKGGQKMAAAFVIVAVMAIAGSVVFSRAKTDRLQSKAKDGRVLMHEAVADIVSSRTVIETLSGSGLGSWWPWYLTEVEGGDLYATGRYVRHTKHGILLYHPHSTVLVLAVEMGLIGVAFLIRLYLAILNALYHALQSQVDSLFAAGVAISSLSLGFDLFLVRRPTRDAVWWILLFGLFGLLSQLESRRRSLRHAG